MPHAHLARRVVFTLCALVPAGAVHAQTGAEDAPPAAEAPPSPPASAGAQPTAPTRVVLTPEAEAQISAADQARAAKLEQQGNQLYGQGRYKEAIAAYRQAFEINGDINLLYTMAISYQQLEAWQECVTTMQQFLERAPPGPKRDRAENALQNCDARIVRDQLLVVESDPPGAQVYLDDRAKGVVGSTPFRTYLRPGPHVIWVEKSGYEPIRKEIEVQVKEPFRLALVLQRIQNVGWLHVDSTIIDATVFIDGKNVGLTPFKEPLAYPAGRHQVVVDRDGYTRFDQHVTVEKGKVTRVDAYMVRTHTTSSWRTPVGWTANVLGLLSIAGGVVAWQLSEDKFNDTDEFEQLALYEKLGYGVGGGLLLVGTTLVIWDAARDEVLDEHRNPHYGEPVSPPPPTAGTIRPAVLGRTIGLGVTF